MKRGCSDEGPPEKESREKLARICDHAVVVLDGLSIVSPLLHDKGPVIAVITRLLALGLRVAARTARKR